MESHNTNHQQRLQLNTNSSSTTTSGSYVHVLKNPDSPMHVTCSPTRTQHDHKTTANEEPSISHLHPHSHPHPHPYVFHCEAFKPHKPKQPGLRANVFVSKDCTRDLSEHIVEENWGADNGMLYKYLDYIFRCQIFDDQVKKVRFSTNEEIVLFHTGLQRRRDHNFVYFVLKQNDPEKRHAEQRWRVPAGCIGDSCFSKEELMDSPYNLEEQHLPQRTKFYNALQELLFDESYQIEVNWPERLRTNKERIYQELKQNVKEIEKNKLVSELTEPFNCALKKAEKRAKANPRLAVAQGFVETKHYKKRVELLLPLKVEYPAESKNYHTFALALRKVENAKKYTGMSLLTMSMAYANARLVGYVDSSWLTNDTKKKERSEKKEDKERSSTHDASPSPNMPQPHPHPQPQQPPQGFNRRAYHHPHVMMNRSQPYNNNNNLAAIPSHGPVNVAYGIQTTNLYPNQNQNQWGSPYQQPPYIADSTRSEQSDQNLPLSLDGPSQPKLRLPNKANNLQYSQSAFPTLSHPPKLHNKILADDEELEEDPMLQELTSGLMLDGTSEREIQNVKISNLKYGASEPPAPVPKPPSIAKTQVQKPQQRRRRNVDYYTAQAVAKLPRQVTKYAQPTTQQRGFVPYQKTHYEHDAHPAPNSIKSNASDNKPKYLLQLSQLPGDCGVNTLRHIFGACVQLQSVHLVDDDKTAVLRFADRNALDAAVEFVAQFSWRAKIIANSPYLKNYDQQHVWQYQESNKWKAHHPEMGELIERIPPRTDLMIAHGNRRYFIEKYNKQQGRQTNLRTRNQRMIRRIRITVWAPRTNPLRALAIPRIISATQPPNNKQAVVAPQRQRNAMYDGFIYGQPPPQTHYNPIQQQRVSQTQTQTQAPRHVLQAQSTKKKAMTKANIVQSTPPRFAAQKEYNKLQPEQRVLPSNIKSGIKYDTTQYDDWQALEDGEDDYALFKEQCNTNRFSGIWWYSGTVHTTIAKGGGNCKRVRLFYVTDDADEAQNLFENGLADLAQGGLGFNLTLYQSIKNALAVIDPEPDDENNLKIFLCRISLIGASQEEEALKENKYITIEAVDRVEMVGCCSINIDVLKKALAGINDDN